MWKRISLNRLKKSNRVCVWKLFWVWTHHITFLVQTEVKRYNTTSRILQDSNLCYRQRCWKLFWVRNHHISLPVQERNKEKKHRHCLVFGDFLGTKIYYVCFDSRKKQRKERHLKDLDFTNEETKIIGNKIEVTITHLTLLLSCHLSFRSKSRLKIR